MRKVKGTIHWVDADTAVDAEVRLYEHLFSAENPEDVPEGKTFLDVLNPASKTVVTAKVEPALAGDAPGVPLQFERHAYFVRDPDDAGGRPVFNRTVTLRDSFRKG